MTRQEIFGTGLSTGRRASRSFWTGMSYAGDGALLFAPIAAFEASLAQRGEYLPTLAGKTTSLITYPALAGIASLGLSLIPGIGPVAAGVLGSILASYPSEVLGNNLSRGFRQFTRISRQLRHLEMGGGYRDTDTAKKQRYRAIQEMNSTLIPSRRYLGQEALLMHR